MTRREQQLTRFRWLDLGLGLAVALLLLVPTLFGWLSVQRALALDVLIGLPLYLWLAWRQYFVVDELSRHQMLVAYSVHGFVTAAGVVLLLARSLWSGQSVGVTPLIAVFLAGWLSSWLSWWWQRRSWRAGA